MEQLLHSNQPFYLHVLTGHRRFNVILENTATMAGRDTKWLVRQKHKLSRETRLCSVCGEQMWCCARRKSTELRAAAAAGAEKTDTVRSHCACPVNSSPLGKRRAVRHWRCTLWRLRCAALWRCGKHPVYSAGAKRVQPCQSRYLGLIHDLGHVFQEQQLYWLAIVSCHGEEGPEI